MAESDELVPVPAPVWLRLESLVPLLLFRPELDPEVELRGLPGRSDERSLALSLERSLARSRAPAVWADASMRRV